MSTTSNQGAPSLFSRAGDDYIHALQRTFDILLVTPLLLLLFPVTVTNLALALLMAESPLQHRTIRDGFNRPLTLTSFRFGFWRRHTYLFSVLTGQLSLCGVSIYAGSATTSCAASSQQIPCGVFSIVDVHRLIGLHIDNPLRLEAKQYKKGLMGYWQLIGKSIFSRLFYCAQAATPRRELLRVFGLCIRNVDMQGAVKWVLAKAKGGPKVAYFVNAHSVNLAARNADFNGKLAQADALFADGSGMRLAVKHTGQRLVGNVNGTDMLPKLCQMAATEGLSLYLLGARPDIAKRAAENLRATYSALRIAGVHHGFFSASDDERLIDDINRSHAGILLVALGSPRQEAWIARHRHRLTCRTILAVGGLFDYYSGAIPRAPLWMRELGLEWVWRLMQEPVVKFKRYVIGTPEFLLRTFLFNQARRGV